MPRALEITPAGFTTHNGFTSSGRYLRKAASVDVADLFVVSGETLIGSSVISGGQQHLAVSFSTTTQCLMWRGRDENATGLLRYPDPTVAAARVG